MVNRRFELFEYRQVLVRMRQGDSDRDIARGGSVTGRRTYESGFESTREDEVTKGNGQRARAAPAILAHPLSG